MNDRLKKIWKITANFFIWFTIVVFFLYWLFTEILGGVKW